MHTLITEIPSGAVELPKRIQTMQAIRQADRTGLPGFAGALAHVLRSELEAEARIEAYARKPTPFSPLKP